MPETQIIGINYTLIVGNIYDNSEIRIEAWGVNVNCTFRVLRVSSELEWRERYNYNGPIPEPPPFQRNNFYEIKPLD